MEFHKVSTGSAAGAVAFIGDPWSAITHEYAHIIGVSEAYFQCADTQSHPPCFARQLCAGIYLVWKPLSDYATRKLAANPTYGKSGGCAAHPPIGLYHGVNY